MNKEILILVGISGSGKTSFSKEFLKNNNNYLRISRDDIRKTLVGDLDGYYQRKDLIFIEGIVSNLEESIFELSFFRERSIIIDNTNLKQSYINNWLDYNEKSYNFKFKLFDISLEEAKLKTIKVRRDNAEFLIGIRKGKYDLNKLLQEAKIKVKELEDEFEKSDLSIKVDRGYFLSLLPKIRKEYYNLGN